MRKLFILLVVAVAVLGLAAVVPAHTPVCSCASNGDGTITCEGGFSDGSSAAGVKISVKDAKTGKVLLKGKMNADSEFTFKKPAVPFDVVFDAGPGHVKVIKGKDIGD
jgi:hypothetical protein